MGDALNILMVEDFSTDAELHAREIKFLYSQCRFLRVETRNDFLSALKSFNPDLILCDYKLPSFDGMTALELSRETMPDTPFIIVTGSINEETAVACMKAGAWDYVLKEHIKRLGPAVQNALDNKRLRLERKAALEKSRRWERVFDQAQFGLAHADVSGNIFIEVNATFARERGYTPEELKGRPFIQIHAPEVRKDLEQRMPQIDKEGHAVFESVHLRKDGGRFPVLMEVTTIKDEHNQPVSRVAYALDITARKQAEQNLRDSEDLFRNVFEGHAAVKLILDPDTGAIVDANQAAADFYGWSRQQLKKMRIDQINTLPPDDIKAMMAQVRTHTRVQFEFHHRRADGSIRDVEVFSSKIRAKGKDFLHSIVHDITERKKAQEALRSNEAILRKSQKTAKLGSWIYVPDGFMTWTKQMYRIFNVSPETFPLGAEAVIRLIHPEDRDALCKFIKACMTGEKTEELEFRTVLSDGTTRHINARGELTRNGQGKAVRLAGTAQDVTDRKRADAERERLEAAISQAGDSIIVTNADGIIQYVNPAFERITGYSQREAIGQTPRILKSDKQDSGFYQNMWRTIKSGKMWGGRIVNKRKDGTLYTEAATISPVRDATGQIINYVAVKRDITEHLRLEAQFRQAQKMESVGRLAGGVAHDYNNMLSVILGYAEMALERVSPTDPLHADLREIFKAADRSRNITRQLLAFARQQTIAPKVIDLNATVESILKILRRLIGEDIDLAWLPASSLWPIKIDPTQIDQILANLCVNARDAIAGVGKLIIRTESTVLDEIFCANHPGCTPGEYVLMTVSDNGTGMDKEVLDNIFEPFFTTKELGKGTGLGLATVYGIVKQNKGFINVSSEPGKGATFNIYLPRHKGTTAGDLRNLQEQIPKGRNETILVVEDDDAILKLVRNILEPLDYTVLTTKSPNEALTMAERHKEEIQLLVTDVVMPEMNGRQLSEQILARYPRIKCLFMSGYTADIIVRQGISQNELNFINKPFTARGLAAMVRNLLDSKTS